MMKRSVGGGALLACLLAASSCGSRVERSANTASQPLTPVTTNSQDVVGPDAGPGSSAAGWVTGKLFEKAAANMPEPPSSVAVLRGLWSLKDDTLGGITAPLTFIEEQAAPKINCWWPIIMRQGNWTTPDGYRMHCR
jgi:hypothetical protein